VPDAPASLDPGDERRLAVGLFNHVWDLLGKPDRSVSDDFEMIHAAHASRYHWGAVGEPVHWARGEWQCSRVYAVLGRFEPALLHAERCLELATAYAKQRKTFGAPLAQRQAIQWPILDMHMDAHKLRLMLHHAAWKFDRGEDCREEAFMVKIFGDERSFWAADRCMQIHGGMGLSKELPIERFFRDQRSMMITEGAIEVLRMALARMILDVR
jgi:hypothetical protein